MSAWQLRRLHHIEAGFFTTGLIDRKDYINDHYKNLDPGDRLAIVVRNDCQGANALAKISLYGARLERSIYRAMHELERLRARRQAESQGPDRFEKPNPIGKQINNIPPERQTPAPVIPIDNPPQRPASIAKPIPPEADMQ